MRPKSDTFATLSSDIRTFLAARSLRVAQRKKMLSLSVCFAYQLHKYFDLMIDRCFVILEYMYIYIQWNLQYRSAL